jgi:large exoprotein involved in heme utilization and adhesion
MTITADSLLLNQGLLLAITGTSGTESGANINLQGLDLLRIDNESLISANALEDANGGNVTIDSTFIVATPPTGAKGSDITANANRGNGGRVNITTQGLFGIEFRDNLTPDNDITASSEAGLDGEVAINQPDVDPSRGLAELPTDVVDATRQIDRRCTPAGAAQRSSFVVTGRGGLPPNPTDPLTGETVIADWVTLDSEEENTITAAPEANPTSTTPKQLVEAQGWVYGSDGQVILVAEAPTATPQSPWSTSPSCQGKSKVKS